MSLLAKLYEWPGVDNLIYPDQWMEEFNQIIDALSGVSSFTRLYVVLDNASFPPLRANQTSTGPLAEFQKSGTTKLSVANSGQIVSAVATGTAPISVTSTTVCTNLNADKLDSLNSTQFVRSDITGEDVLGDFQITKASTGTQSLIIAVDNDIATFKRSSDGATIFSITGLNSATRVLNLPSTLNATSAFTPSGGTDVIRVTDASNYRIKEHSTGNIITPVVSTRYGGFISPGAGTVTALKASFGTKGTSITIQVHKNESSQGSITVTSSDTVNTTYTSDIGDFSIAADDRVSLYVSALSGVWGDLNVSALMTV